MTGSVGPDQVRPALPRPGPAPASAPGSAPAQAPRTPPAESRFPAALPPAEEGPARSCCDRAPPGRGGYPTPDTVRPAGVAFLAPEAPSRRDGADPFFPPLLPTASFRAAIAHSAGGRAAFPSAVMVLSRIGVVGGAAPVVAAGRPPWAVARRRRGPAPCRAAIAPSGRGPAPSFPPHGVQPDRRAWRCPSGRRGRSLLPASRLPGRPLPRPAARRRSAGPPPSRRDRIPPAGGESPYGGSRTSLIGVPWERYTDQFTARRFERWVCPRPCERCGSRGTEGRRFSSWRRWPCPPRRRERCWSGSARWR